LGTLRFSFVFLGFTLIFFDLLSISAPACCHGFQLRNSSLKRLNLRPMTVNQVSQLQNSFECSRSHCHHVAACLREIFKHAFPS
jgi:hypothetical protein